jgi:glycosyltransferase involved in cell wall biosynthesis
MIKRMNIAIISDNPNAHAIGGGDYAVYKYAEALAKRGHAVDVYGTFYHDFMSTMCSVAGLNIHLRGGCTSRLRGAGKVNRIWDILYTYVYLLPRLFFSNNRPDFIFGYQRYSSIKAYKLGRLLNVPVVHFAFEPPTHMLKMLGNKFERVFKGRLRREWDSVRDAYCSSAALLPLSASVGKDVAEWTGRSVNKPIYVGLDRPRDLNKANEFTHILYIGRLDYAKNVHDLIDAISVLKCPPSLIIAGGGYDASELKNRARSVGVNAIFPGVVSDVEKWRLISTCLFLVFPSSVEGFGMPPGEALMCMRPAICSDIPVLREVYEDYVYYFKLHDTKSLAGIMQHVLDHPIEANERAVRGNSWIMKRYSWDLSASRIEESISLLTEYDKSKST